jgi:transcriptional regulator with XRE-family HTH domain
MNDGSYAVAKDGEGSMVAEDGLNDDTAKAVVPSGTFAQSASSAVSVRLLDARRALGLSAADVAVRTRITLRHIEALEAGDYSAMPGRPYIIGFAKSYARAVGLKDAEIAEAVRSELEGVAPRPEPRILSQFEVGDPAKTPTRLIGWLALLLVGAILAMGGVFWRSYYAPSVPLPSLVTEVVQPSADLTRKQATAAPTVRPAPASNGPVVFTALEEGIWVKFYDGRGKQLLQKQLAKGESYTVPGDAESPKLWTGRPDALSITIGGQPIPRLAEAERVMKDVPIDPASLRARPLAEVTAAPRSQGTTVSSRAPR